MNTATIILLLFSSGSFFFFGTLCLISPRLIVEFSRYRLARWRTTVGAFQLLGATGLLVGLLGMSWAARVSSAGLAVLMLLGVGVRLKIRDSFVQILPALVYLVLNAWLFLRLI